MKTITSLLFVLLFAIASTQAQTSKPADAAKTTKETKVHSKTKADGTPDKRYKENKETSDGPKKKDGTPDKRYKKNKNG